MSVVSVVRNLLLLYSNHIVTDFGLNFNNNTSNNNQNLRDLDAYNEFQNLTL